MESPETSPVTLPTLPQRPRRPTRDLPARPDVTIASPFADAVTAEAVPLPLNKTSVDDSKSLESDVEALKRSSEADQPPVDTTTLTPLRAHYLKKALLALEFNKELTYISSSPLPSPISVLSLLGPPFTPLPRSALERGGVQDVPFLRFMFRQFVLTFPFLATAPKDFFPSKLQPFADSLLSRNLSSELTLFPEENPDADDEQKGTAKALAKIEKHMALLLGSAIKLVEDEEVVRLTQRDLDRLEAGVRKRERRQDRSKAGQFNVNVICVRNISEKGRVRKRHHEVYLFVRSEPAGTVLTAPGCYHKGIRDSHSSRRFRRCIRFQAVWGLSHSCGRGEKQSYVISPNTSKFTYALAASETSSGRRHSSSAK
jgi:hypothetical protein